MSTLRFREYGDTDIEALAGSFRAAQPFPHVVIPDFIRLPPADVLGSFPDMDTPGWRLHLNAYEAEKSTFSNLDLMPEPLASMVRDLNSPAYLQFLERLTGIKALLPDPYLQGAGLHRTGPGGVCAPHTDGQLNERLSIFRRVNTLIYLNPGWQPDDGGSLEFYSGRRGLKIERSVVPTWGTCVIFQSDARSVHGFTQAIAPGHSRLAVAVYHYTSVGAGSASNVSMTHFWQKDEHWKRTSDSLVVRRARMHLYGSLRFAAKSLAYLAYLARPAVPARSGSAAAPESEQPG